METLKDWTQVGSVFGGWGVTRDTQHRQGEMHPGKRGNQAHGDLEANPTRACQGGESD